MKCKTCGGNVKISQVASDSLCRFSVAECHGMYFAAMTVDEHGNKYDLDESAFKSVASSMPVAIDEYYVDESFPMVNDRTEKLVDISVAKAARVGAYMKIDGERGKVTGIGYNPPTVVLDRYGL